MKLLIMLLLAFGLSGCVSSDYKVDNYDRVQQEAVQKALIEQRNDFCTDLATSPQTPEIMAIMSKYCVFTFN